MTTSPIPKTAPFAEEDIDILNRVVGPATPIQRAWLAGFLAGLDAAASSAQPAAAPRPAEPLTIVFASESGNSERLANDMAKAARKQGFKPSVVDMADLDVATLATARRLVVIAATWGEGDPPARAIRAYADLMGEKAPRLDNVEFAVLALGDTAYVEFCAVGKAIDARLEALGGKRVADRADLDLDFAEPAGRWIETTLHTLAPATDRGRVIAVDFGAKDAKAPANLDIVEAEVSEHINLNSSRSDKQTIHLELAFDGDAPAYAPGDSLDLYPENDPVALDQFLKAVGLTVDNPLRVELAKSRDITTLSLKTIETFVAATGNTEAKALLDSGDARNWIVGRQLIDLLEAYPTALTPEQIRGLTRPLAPRAYSIAS
jgi:sulfite reductase (NADPH) flavoprotein alpha-component